MKNIINMEGVGPLVVETGFNFVAGLAATSFTKGVKGQIATIWAITPVIKFIYYKLDLLIGNKLNNNTVSYHREIKWTVALVLPATFVWWNKICSNFFTGILLQLALLGVHQVARDYKLIK